MVFVEKKSAEVTIATAKNGFNIEYGFYDCDEEIVDVAVSLEIFQKRRITERELNIPV